MEMVIYIALKDSGDICRNCLRHFIPPLPPLNSGTARKQLKVWTRATVLNHVIQLVGFSGMFAFLDCTNIYLTPPSLSCAERTPPPKKNEFCHIAEIKPYPTPIRAPIFTHLIPYQVSFIGKPPTLHNFKPFKN